MNVFKEKTDQEETKGETFIMTTRMNTTNVSTQSQLKSYTLIENRIPPYFPTPPHPSLFTAFFFRRPPWGS